MPGRVHSQQRKAVKAPIGRRMGKCAYLSEHESRSGEDTRRVAIKRAPYPGAFGAS